jgi:predicted AAA+ superfamily ATPase
MQEALWLRGGFPRSFLAESEGASVRWREAFISSFLERDVPQLGFRIPSVALRRFWTMLAHYHGRAWNASELARSIGASPKTASQYRDVLEGSFMVRVLPPWFANLKKRQVKAPKVYVRDPGLLHSLLGVNAMSALRSHPQYGASWEGYALEQVLAIKGSSENAYFWSTQGGAELDLLVFAGGRPLGFEFKCADAPTMTKSMHVALEDLALEELYVIYPGSKGYRLHEKVRVLPLRECNKLEELFIDNPDS